MKPPPPPKKNAGSGGINPSEIQQVAKRRSGSTLDSIKDLEEKMQQKGKTDEDTHPPWAGQLLRKKPPGEDSRSTTSLEEKSELEKRFSMLPHSDEVNGVEDPSSAKVLPPLPPAEERENERPPAVATRQLPPKAQPSNTPPIAARKLREPHQASGKAAEELPSDEAVTQPKPLPKPKPVQLPPKTLSDPPAQAAERSASHPKPPPKPASRSIVQQVEEAALTTEPEQKAAQPKPIPEPKPRAAQPKPIPEPEQNVVQSKPILEPEPKAAQPKPIPEPEQKADVAEKSWSQPPVPLISGPLNASLTSSPKADKPRPPLKPRTLVEGTEPISRPQLPPKQPVSVDGNEEKTTPIPPPSDKPIPDKPLPSMPQTAIPSPIQKRQWPPSPMTPIPPSPVSSEGNVPPEKLAEKTNSFQLPPEREQTPPPSPLFPTHPNPPTPVMKTSAEPTPTMGPLQKVRRRPLEMVDSNKPPPLPSRNTKPGRGGKCYSLLMTILLYWACLNY